MQTLKHQSPPHIKERNKKTGKWEKHLRARSRGCDEVEAINVPFEGLRIRRQWAARYPATAGRHCPAALPGPTHRPPTHEELGEERWIFSSRDSLLRDLMMELKR